MNSFLEYSNHLAPLHEEAANDLLDHVSVKTLSKAEYLLKHGEICRHLFFIDHGLVKLSFYGEEKEFIMRFFPDKTMFTVLDSFITQKPSTYQVIAIEPTEISCLSQHNLEDLCKRHHCIETFFRKLVSLASVNMMKRVSEMLEENATARYNNFVRDNGDLVQRISLGDLANYLGITQVSLSRIRGKK